MTADTTVRRQPAARPGAAVRRRLGRTVLHKIMLYIGRVVVVAVPIALWQISVDNGWVGSFVASSPDLIWAQFWEWLTDGTILAESLHTFGEALSGYVIGVLVGSLLAVGFASSRWVSAVYLPFMSALNAVPRLTFAPLFVAWLGFGASSKIALVILVTTYVIFFAVYNGLREVDTEMVGWVRCLGGRRRSLWRHVRIPAIVGWVLASLRVTVGLAVGAAVTAEFLGSSQGLGYLVSNGANLFHPADVYAGLLAVVVVVGLVDTMLRQLERRLTRWTT